MRPARSSRRRAGNIRSKRRAALAWESSAVEPVGATPLERPGRVALPENQGGVGVAIHAAVEAVGVILGQRIDDIVR